MLSETKSRVLNRSISEMYVDYRMYQLWHDIGLLLDDDTYEEYKVLVKESDRIDQPPL